MATPVLGSGANRVLGFALGGPSVPPGMVLYRQSALGPVKAPREAGTAPFDELNVVLYDASRPVRAQVVATTTKHLPLAGRVSSLAFPVGASHWLLAVSSAQPLVGTVAAWAPWIALAVGLAASALIAATLEQAVRRRNAAVALYRSEHRIAETLQHRLLPTLATVPGLDIASRYVAASDSQQVGGDWFDVFDLGDGRTAVVIGDVMGHDIEAAAAMAQIRAALRAYALENDEPAPVLERLAHLVDAFDVTGLVTVIYGVLGPPDSDGARQFRWANAGHLPPLVKVADGHVQRTWRRSLGCHRRACDRATGPGSGAPVAGLLLSPVHRRVGGATRHCSNRLDSRTPVLDRAPAPWDVGGRAVRSRAGRQGS